MKFIPLLFGLVGCSSFYQGPESNHFDGKFFKNRKSHYKSPSDLLKLAFGGPSTPWPEWVAIEQQKDIQPRNNKGIRATFINHATFLVQVEGVNFLTDPIFGERASPVGFAGPKRVHAPGVAMQDLPPIDFVVISHDHYDHLDKFTIKHLAKQENPPLFIVPLGVGARLESMDYYHYQELDWGDYTDVGGLRVWLLECQHRSGRGILDHKKTLWGSYAIESKVGRVYFAGDTGYSPHFKEQGNQFKSFDLALLPIGAYEPRWFMHSVHVDPTQAVEAHKDLNSEYSIGMHFGTFKLTYESIDDPVKQLTQLTQSQKVMPFIAPKPGQIFNLAGKPRKKIPTTTGVHSPQKWLQATPLIDATHPKILQLAKELTGSISDEHQKAVVIHDFVRDEISFGWEQKFADYKASEVLEMRRGFCLTKTTLFIALLRASGIPARPRFVEISAQIFQGLNFNGMQGFLDHSYTEVYFDEQWVPLDSYVVPKAMVQKAKYMLDNSSLTYGYGLAMLGQSEWDGYSASFVQYVDDPKLRRRGFAMYRDAADFYKYESKSNNGGAFHRFVFPYVFKDLNNKLTEQLGVPLN